MTSINVLPRQGELWRWCSNIAPTSVAFGSQSQLINNIQINLRDNTSIKTRSQPYIMFLNVEILLLSSLLCRSTALSLSTQVQCDVSNVQYLRVVLVWYTIFVRLL